MKAIWVCVLLPALLFGCKKETQPVDSQLEEVPVVAPEQPRPIKPVCSAPPPVKDIWALEPMLIEKGLITEDMSKEERAEVIRAYINKKNEYYEQCLKGTVK